MILSTKDRMFLGSRAGMARTAGMARKGRQQEGRGKEDLDALAARKVSGRDSPVGMTGEGSRGKRRMPPWDVAAARRRREALEGLATPGRCRRRRRESKEWVAIGMSRHVVRRTTDR